MLNYRYRACQAGMKEQVVEMAINGSGIRDTARVFKINKNTIIRTLKKSQHVGTSSSQAHWTQHKQRAGSQAEAAYEAEMDEQWSYVGDKSNQRWLWYAIDHATNTVLAYVFGKRQDEVFQYLKTRLEPYHIVRYYTDNWGSYQRHLEPDKHEIGKRNTQKIERKNLNFRTWIKRLNRKTICFSKLEVLHDTVIGLLINKVEFGIDIHA